MNWEDVVSSLDIAVMFGVSKSTVSNWKVRYATFPKPVARVSQGAVPLYSCVAVITWHRAQFRKGS